MKNKQLTKKSDLVKQENSMLRNELNILRSADSDINDKYLKGNLFVSKKNS